MVATMTLLSHPHRHQLTSARPRRQNAPLEFRVWPKFKDLCGIWQLVRERARFCWTKEVRGSWKDSLAWHSSVQSGGVVHGIEPGQYFVGPLGVDRLPSRARCSSSGSHGGNLIDNISSHVRGFLSLLPKMVCLAQDEQISPFK